MSLGFLGLALLRRSLKRNRAIPDYCWGPFLNVVTRAVASFVLALKMIKYYQSFVQLKQRKKLEIDCKIHGVPLWPYAAYKSNF